MAITGSPRLRLRLALPRSQRPLRRGEDSGDPWIEPGRLGERPTDRLEHGLGDVVEIVAVVHGHVQRHLGVERERAEEFLEQIEVEVGHARPRDRNAEDQKGSPRQIDRGRDERLVHRNGRSPVAHDPLLLTEGLPEGLTEDDAHVLHGVMLVDLDVALRVDREVHQAVLRPRLQHVAEERDRRLHLRGAGAVEVEVKRDLGLLRLAFDARLPARRLGAHAVPPPSVRSRRSAALPCPARASTRARGLSWAAATFGISSPAAVTRSARAIGSCSAWASMSLATQSGSAVASATTTTSLGPATMSIPTSPKTRAFARAT